MSTIKFPWKQQPNCATTINWNNPITRGLVFATEGSVPMFDFVTNSFSPNTIGSGVSIGCSHQGKSYNFSGTVADGACSFGNRTELNGATQATWDIQITFNSGDSHFFGQWDSSFKWLLQKNGTSLVWVAADDDSSNRRRWDGAVFPGSGSYRIIASWSGTSNIYLLVNGIDKTSTMISVNAVATSIGTTTDALQLGTVNSGVDLNGNITFARIWNRGLSQIECKSLYETPWQIFNA